MGNQALGAACVFESHLSTHPVIRLNTEALVLAVQIYSELNHMEYAVDIVDFVEEYEIRAPEVFNTLLQAYIRRGEVRKAEELVLRMKNAQCEITLDLYFKLAQLFASNDREDAIHAIYQEALMWFPEDAHRIQSVIIRYYLANDRMEDAQRMMRDMYVSGVPFHSSIFATLLETRLRHNMPDAIIKTLEEMNTLKVTPNSEFSLSALNALLQAHTPEMCLKFIEALQHGNYLRTPQFYHIIMKYHLKHGQHVENVNTYKALREDKMVPLSRYSFVRVIPSLAAFSSKLKASQDPIQKKAIRAAYTPLLFMVLEDLIAAPIEPEPMTVGYLIDLLALEHPQEALRLAKHGFSQLQKGVWKRSAGAINATAYGLYHYGTLEDQCAFADFVINSQIIPPAYVIAIITRQMRHEAEACAPETPTECRFDLPEFIKLLERHAFHLELPTYIVDRFATALLERGLAMEASQMFATAMQSLKPIDQRNFNSYKEAASWLEDLPELAAVISERSKKITRSRKQSTPSPSTSSTSSPSSKSSFTDEPSFQSEEDGAMMDLAFADLDRDLTPEQKEKTAFKPITVDVDQEQQYLNQYASQSSDFTALVDEDEAVGQKTKPKPPKFQDTL